MRLVRDARRCTGCGLCLEACPQLRGKRDPRILGCDCSTGDCFYACPRGAIVEAGRLLTIDAKRCDNCGDCVKACPKHAIVAHDGRPAKCDLCLGRPKCVGACPAGALRLEPDGTEREAVRRLVGWEKLDLGPVGKVAETGANYVVADVGGRLCFLTRTAGPGPEEARLLSSVVAAFREGRGAWRPEAVAALIDDYCDAEGLEATPGQRRMLLARVEREVRGFSVLDEFLVNDRLEEVAVIGAGSPLYVYHRRFGWLQTDVRITNERRILNLINRIGRRLGRRVTLQRPRLNAPIDGGRLHAAVAPVAVSGNCMTLRLFGSRALGPRDFVANRTISAEALAFLWFAARADANVLVCGNTGSGKTTLLNIIAGFFPAQERLVAVEETPEIRLDREHSVRLVVSEELGVRMHELVADTLRMRPDRVVVGEVRTPEEARALMDTMLAGQGKSSLATFHAQNADEALVRLRALGLNAVDLCSLDLIVVQRRWTLNARNEDVRRVTEIASVRKDYSAGAATEPIYTYDAATDRLVRGDIAGSTVFRRIRDSFGLEGAGFAGALAKKAEELADA